MELDILFEQREQQLWQYFCLISKHHRYDLMIACSQHFQGKSMVTSIQTGNMVLICQEDIDNTYMWAKRLGVEEEDITEFQEFFGQVLATWPLQEQY